MSPQSQGAVRAAQAWLQSSWQVQVPFPWLEACVDWLQEEGEGRPLSQPQLNQQVLDQWLLTDLRDLAHPVLPQGLSQAQKTELSGVFCLQVDSLLDVSQPAYGQLQRWRGTDCANEDVSAVTQATQRPWEARPSRMLLLQLTDGVQSLEAMEYRPIPALGAPLRPGAKLQLRGQMVCRLGVLLLGPGNVEVLGGEVEELVERNGQGRVLCRALGLPEEEPPQGGGGQQEDPVPPGNRQEPEDDELDDQELLASLEAQEERQDARRPRPSLESGYGTRSETSSGTLQSHASGSASYGGTPPRRWEDPPPRPAGGPQPVGVVDDFPYEDFDDLPMDELDNAIFQESAAAGLPPPPPAADGRPGAPPPSPPDARNGDRLDSDFDESNDFLDERDDFPDEDMDCLFPPEPERPREEPPPGETASGLDAHQNPGLRTQATRGLSTRNLNLAIKTEQSPSAAVEAEPENSGSVTLDSPPFTYLCLLQNRASSSRTGPVSEEVRVKAFIVTLLGNLQSAGGEWRVGASISDGTGYLEVALSDRVLTGLLGFSVARKAALKRDPARKAELAAGMRACQAGLVDMCCVMTLRFGPAGGGVPVVARTDDVTVEDCLALEERVRGRRGR